MPRKTCCNKHWLTSGSKDNNQVDVSEWCCDVKEDPYSAFCKVCHKRFSFGNMGFAQILSHGDAMKHKSFYIIFFKISGAAGQGALS
jgi:hypothetical protein